MDIFSLSFPLLRKEEINEVEQASSRVTGRELSPSWKSDLVRNFPTAVAARFARRSKEVRWAETQVCRDLETLMPRKKEMGIQSR